MKTKAELVGELSHEFNSCQSFIINHDESIHNFVNGDELRDKLPSHFCTMIFYNPITNSLVFGTNPRKTGTKEGGQNIFTFFKNVGSNDYPKWKQLQEEMQEKNIEKIVVVVFWNKLFR